MPTTAEPAVEQAVRDLHRDLCAAMTAADPDALDPLLAKGFTLTHMTGYRQDREEWLSDVASGEMAYHRIADAALDVDASDPARPVLTARTRTDATIWGSRGDWRLQLVSTFVQVDGRWVFARTVASTW